MTIEETIYRLRQEANEWDWLRSSTKEDEENGFKCRFSEGSEEYARRVEEITRIADWLEELQTLRKAYEMMAVKYCKHTTCYFCEVTDKCELYLGTKKGGENLMEYFLSEAKKNEADKC